MHSSSKSCLELDINSPIGGALDREASADTSKDHDMIQGGNTSTTSTSFIKKLCGASAGKELLFHQVAYFHRLLNIGLPLFNHCN